MVSPKKQREGFNTQVRVKHSKGKGRGREGEKANLKIHRKYYKESKEETATKSIAQYITLR